MRGTTLIYSAITRETFWTSKVRRYNGRSRHSLLDLSFGMPLAKVFGERRAAPLINRSLSVCRIVPYSFWSKCFYLQIELYHTNIHLSIPFFS